MGALPGRDDLLQEGDELGDEVVEHVAGVRQIRGPPVAGQVHDHHAEPVREQRHDRIPGVRPVAHAVQ